MSVNKKIKITARHKFKFDIPEMECLKQYIVYYFEESDYHNYQLDDGIWLFAEKGDMDNWQFLINEYSLEHYLGDEEVSFKSKDGLFNAFRMTKLGLGETDYQGYDALRKKDKLKEFLND